MTSRSQIPGAVDWRTLAERHRPSDPSALAKEVKRLARDGLTARDVAEVLGLNVAVVAAILEAST
jgi:hypothetical protein